ncbi:MAG: hypothetical protein HC818_06415 [Synechococcaceae cyanobacterium RM1_1_27]|nr:hypothetical protein [Synechococcaceae cyanobacterium RM1_1_27]
MMGLGRHLARLMTFTILVGGGVAGGFWLAQPENPWPERIRSSRPVQYTQRWLSEWSGEPWADANTDTNTDTNTDGENPQARQPQEPLDFATFISNCGWSGGACGGQSRNQCAP